MDKLGSIFVIFVLGAPAAGKGTLCRLLSEAHNLYHLSVGDLLRTLENAKTKNSETEIIAECLRKSRLVPGNLLVPILKKEIADKMLEGYERFLVDGFPRDMEQSIAFEKKACKPWLVIFINCPKAAAKERYLSRKLPGRLEDDEGLFEKRYKQFEKENPEILQHFLETGRLLEIDTSGEMAESFKRLVEVLDGHALWKSFIEGS